MNKQWDVLSDSVKKQDNENIISYILRLKGIKDYKNFLNPSAENLIPFNQMKNIEEASEIVVDGIKNNKTFGIYFDVDLDGICSGTIMYKYLESFNINTLWMINVGKIHEISSDKSALNCIDILIVVDSLNTDYSVYSDIKSKGIDIIILDHHDFDNYPEDAILVSSAKDYDNPNLSGSGVTWKFCAYLDTILNTSLSNDLIDLCAAGIIGDVSDISENSPENRYLCSQGIYNPQSTALKIIIGNYQFNAQSIIWSIAPLINAANRMSRNDLAVEFFLCDDKKQSKKYLDELKNIKIEQDLLVKDNVEYIINDILSQYKSRNKVLYGVVESKSLSGLIASQIAGEYKIPTIIFHKPDSKNKLKGSIRGYGIDDFKSIVNSTELAVSKGHPNAAGITCYYDNMHLLIKELNEILKDMQFSSIKEIDIKLEVNNISEMLINAITKINCISGKGFNPVNVLIENVEINNPCIMKDKHVKFEYSKMTFLYWNNPEFYNEIKDEDGYYKVVDVVGELQINTFAGKKQKQFIINDFKNLNVYPEFLKDI